MCRCWAGRGNASLTPSQRAAFVADVDEYLDNCRPVLRRWVVRNVVVSSAIMLIIAASLYIVFKRKKWL